MRCHASAASLLSLCICLPPWGDRELCLSLSAEEEEPGVARSLRHTSRHHKTAAPAPKPPTAVSRSPSARSLPLFVWIIGGVQSSAGFFFFFFSTPELHKQTGIPCLPSSLLVYLRVHLNYKTHRQVGWIIHIGFIRNMTAQAGSYLGARTLLYVNTFLHTGHLSTFYIFSLK